MATPKIRYEKNIAGVNELMNGPEMVALLARVAESGGKYAAGISPHGTSIGEHYADSFRVETSTKSGPKHDRAEARLVNDSDHATAVEYINHGGERVLGRTVDYIETRGADA